MRHEEFIQKMSSMDSNVVILNEYETNETSIRCSCKRCSNTWEAKAKNLLRGRTRCPECAKKEGKSRYKLTNEDFIKRSSIISPTIEIIGVYESMDTYVECKCKKCSSILKFKPSSLLYRGTSCPECRKKTKHRNIKKTHEEFLNDLHKVTTDIEILSEYKDAKTKVKCRCKVCGHEWESKPPNLITGYGCRKCGIRKTADRSRKTKTDVEKQVNSIFPHIDIIGEYKNGRTPIECRCNKCGTTWFPTVDNLLKGEGCPYCAESHGERAIRAFLDSHNIKYIGQKRFDKLLGLGGGGLSFDFYIPEYNLLIEYQGIQHEKPISKFGGIEQFKKQQEHDRRKREYAESNGFKLLEIWYYDNDKIGTILNENLSVKIPVTITA